MYSNRPQQFFITIFAAAALLIQSGSAFAACRYTFQPGSGVVEWTAFKTTDKVAVRGRFDSVTWRQRQSAEWPTALRGSTFSIDTSSVNSGDSGRDRNLMKHFFGKMIGKRSIQGSVQTVEGQSMGALIVRLTMNKITKKLPLTYQMDGEGRFEASGTLDILDWNLQPAISALHEACVDQHTGKDGVAKTWSEIAVRVRAQFTKQCK